LKETIDLKQFQESASILKAVAHPVRMGVITLLTRYEALTVTDMCGLLQLEQPLISHHLAKMRLAGVLENKRDGKNMRYKLIITELAEAIHCLDKRNSQNHIKKVRDLN